MFQNSKCFFFNPAPPPPQPIPPPFFYGQPGQISPQEAIARAEWNYRNTLYLNNPVFNTNNPFYISPYGSFFPPTTFPLYTLSTNSGSVTGTRPTQSGRRPTTESGEEVTEEGGEEELTAK